MQPSWTKRYGQQAVQESLYGQHGNFQPQQSQPQNVQPAPQWNYRTATTDMQGQPLPAGAQGFDPLGRPFFGDGIKGTLKRYYWQLMGSPQTGLGADNWEKIVTDYQKINAEKPAYAQDKNVVKENAQAMTDIAGSTVKGLFDAPTAGAEQISKDSVKQQTALTEQFNEALKQSAKAQGIVLNGTNTQSVVANDENLRVMLHQLNEQTRKNVEGVGVTGGGTSLLTPLVRASQVGVTALMDLFSESAIKTEQTLGAIENARSQTPGVIQVRNDLANLLLNMIPPVAAFNAAKYILAPVSVEERKEALKEGWDAGRIYYTGMYNEAIKEEFISRAKNGESPQLLAMELANPWAETAGQLILDPLNVIGFVEKAAKAAQVTDDAITVVKTSGLADDAKHIENTVKLAQSGTDAEAVKNLETFITDVHSYFHKDGVAKVFTPQEYGALALNSSGNRARAVKKMGNIMTWVVSSMVKDHRGIDDVNEALTALVKLSSPNLNEVSDATITLTHMPSPMTYFNQDALETSVMIRNMLTDADGVIDVEKLTSKLKVENGNWKSLGNRLKGVMDDAAKYQYPSVTEMRLASENAKKAEAIGNKVPANTARLAEQYKQIEKTRPGLIKLANLDELTSKPKDAVNKVLGTFYFSLNYGFATRNYLQNNLITLIDAGPKAWFRDGQYLSDKFIGEELGKWFEGGLLPPAIDNYKTIGQELAGGDKKILGVLPSGTSLSSKAELSASKRVYYKFFRDTMDRMLQPGRILPTLEEFKTAGFTEQQVKNFTSLVNSNYGDINKAVAEFNNAYNSGGLDMWKMVDSLISEDVYKGLKDNGMMDEIINFTKQEGVGKEDINSFFERMVNEQKRRALSISDDPTGLQTDSTFVRVRADVSASSEKYTKAQVQANLDQLFERSTQTRDAYIKALQEVRDKYPDPELSKFLDSLMMREPDDRIRKVVQGINENARNVINKAKKNNDYQTLWKQLGADIPFEGNTFEEFRSAVWDYTLNGNIPEKWNSHFGAVFEQSEKFASKYGQTELLEQARRMNQEAQQWRTTAYRGSKYEVNLIKADLGTPEHLNNIYAMAQGYDIGGARNKILNTINKYAGTEYEKLDDIPLDIAEQAFAKKANTDVSGFSSNIGEGTHPTVRPVPAPPYITGSTPTFARAHAETSEGALDALNQLKEKMLSTFGVKATDEFTPEMAEKMIAFSKDATNKVAEGRLVAQKVAEYWRDFALLPYGETTNLDHALSYIYPYQFWYSRSYASWAKRLASDPQIIAAYAKLKDNMALAHKESPEWWKYNVELPEFMWGLNNGNPMYVNLEATLWPLYGLTGVDFNDSHKRQDWFSATVDDLGKFGPSVWSPINLAMAVGYSMKGEQDMAARWAGRLVPQTATIKAIMAELGATPLELDPAVMTFSGNKPFDTHALDPYERNRVGRALAQMVENGDISEEQAIEVARLQGGPIWDQAVTNATQLRAPGQIASSFLGVGFKARTEEDIQIDNFYQDYYKMQELHNGGLMSDEQYKQQFNILREQYPFMDTVLLSRKAGEDRESAYAYNVISRIPPGSTSEIYEIVGIDPQTAEKFYDSGGSFKGWNEQEKQEFMTAMINVGTMLAIPSNASRKEWTSAKLVYKDMQEGMKAEFGENVLDQIEKTYEMTDAERKAYLEKFPNVEMAMRAKDAYVMASPILSTYYGGLDVTNRYYSNQMYSQLDKEFGSDISDKIDYYHYLKDFVSEKDAQIYYKQENLKSYYKRRDELQQETNIKIAKSANNIPDGPGVLTYNEPQNPRQKAIQDYATGPSQDQQIANDVWPQLSPSMQSLIGDYYQGEDLPYSVEKRLDYLARDYGMSANELLRILGVEALQ
jgi:hypothetical protein